MKRMLLLFTFILSSKQLIAVEETLLLRAGFSAGKGTIRSKNINFTADGSTTSTNNNDDDDNIKHYGINSQFGYKWVNWELLAGSHITFSKVENLRFKAGNDRFYGSGSYKNVTINPLVKYITPWAPVNNWRFYLSTGPVWAIQTIKLKNFQSNTNLIRGKFKLTYESFGTTLSFGIEEQAPYKEMHPVYLEVTFFATESYKVSVVDTSDFARTNILTDSSSDKDIENYGFVITMGLTLF